MDRVGKTLLDWTRALAIENDPKVAAALKLPTLHDENKAKAVKMEAAKKAASSTAAYVCVMTQKKEKPYGETLDILYNGDKEAFYFQLFSKLQQLARCKIAYTDINYGNIIPNWGSGKGVQLIDFDGASIVERVSEAAFTVLGSLYGQSYMKEFEALPRLSEKSRDLIRWFRAEEEKEVKFIESLLLEPLDGKR